MCLVVSACSGGPAPVAGPPATLGPVAGGRLILGAAGQPARLQPAIDGPGVLNALTYETFAQFDPQTGEVTSGFGSISQGADGRTYTVDIDERAVWSDGSPVSGIDWVTTIKAIARGTPTGDWSSEFGQFRQIVGYDDYASRAASGISGLTALGRRLTVTLRSVLCAGRTMFAAIPPLPSHVFGKYVDGDGARIADAPENLNPPVGSGPFLLKEWRRGDHMVFARNPRYWRGAPLLDEIVFRVIPSGTAVEQLANGGIMGVTIRPADVSAVEKLPGVKVYRYATPGYEFVAWNARSASAPMLRDRNVRQALAHAVDVDPLVRELAPHGARVSTHIPSSSWAFTVPNVIRYDPGRADSLLKAAGLTKGPDGTLNKDGRPFQIRFTTNRDNPLRVAIVQYVGDQLRKVGIRVSDLPEPSLPLTLERLYGGDWDAWVGGLALPPDPGETIWHSRSIPAAGDSRASGKLNFPALAMPAVDSSLQEATSPANADCSTGTRRLHYAAASRLIEEEQPLLFLFAEDRFDVAPADLRGFATGPRSYRFYLPEIHRWWFARPSATRTPTGP